MTSVKLTKAVITRFIIAAVLLAGAWPARAQRGEAAWVSAAWIALSVRQPRVQAGWTNAQMYCVVLAGTTVMPARVGCETRLAGLVPRGWPYQPVREQLLYLGLAQPAPQDVGATILASNGVVLAHLPAWGTAATRCVQVDSIGYATDDTRQRIMVGDWLGTGGALPLAPATGTWSLVRAGDATAVWHGVLTCVASNDHESGAQVYAADLPVCTATSLYYVVVDDVGRSPVFAIEPRAHALVVDALGRALYHQRCGTAIGPPYTMFAHGVCHTGLAVLVDFYHSMDDVMRELPAHVVQPATRMDCRGGWHDAGDYDRAGWHIFVVNQLLDAFTMAPGAFQDRQWNIPESGNGVPDILDEAAWGLQWFLRMQDTNDGGIFYRVETADYGHVMPDADHQQLYVMQKYPKYTTYAAAVFAQAARVLAPWITPSYATQLCARAVQAYTFGAAHNAPADARGMAAAELYLTTGDQRYHEEFLRSAARQSWSYATAPTGRVDTVAQAACRRHFVTMADDALREQQRHVYPCYTDGREQGLGISAGRAVTACMRAYAVTRLPQYRDGARMAAHVQCGLNALGMSWITGIGVRPPSEVTHAPSVEGGRGMVPGLPIFGPRRLDEQTRATHARVLWQVSEPKPYPWMRLWGPARAIPQINEFTVREIAEVLAGYAALEAGMTAD